MTQSAFVPISTVESDDDNNRKSTVRIPNKTNQRKMIVDEFEEEAECDDIPVKPKSKLKGPNKAALKNKEKPTKGKLKGPNKAALKKKLERQEQSVYPEDDDMSDGNERSAKTSVKPTVNRTSDRASKKTSVERISSSSVEHEPILMGYQRNDTDSDDDYKSVSEVRFLFTP